MVFLREIEPCSGTNANQWRREVVQRQLTKQHRKI